MNPTGQPQNMNDLMKILNQNANTPQAQPIQDTTQQPQDSSNPFLDFVLPTAGAVGGEVLGGPLGAGIGGGAGQAASDLLQGKTPGGDVLATGGFSLAGGAFGKLLPFLGGGLLKGAGEDLATGGLNLTKGIANRIAIKNEEPILATLTKNGLAGADSAAVDSKLQSLYQFHGDISKSLPFDFGNFAKNADLTLSDIGNNAAYGPESGLYKGVNEKIQNVLGQVSDGKFNLDKQLANFDAATRDAQFNPGAEAGVNRTMGNVLRQTMYDTADAKGLKGPNGETWQKFGLNLRNLQRISDAAASREGMGGHVFGFNSLLGSDIGTHVAAAVGANPLVGLLFGGMGVAKSLIRKSPELAGVLSQGLTKTGAGISALAPILGAAGAGQGANFTKNSMISGGSPTGTNENNGQNNSGDQSNIPSFLKPVIPQNGGNVNSLGTNSNPNEQNTPQFQLTSGESLPTKLPAAEQLGNSIPGSIYNTSDYLADVKKWNDYAAANPYSAQAQQLADRNLSTINARQTLNQRIQDVNLRQQGLTPQQSGFVLSAPPTWQALTDLHQAITSAGGSGIFNFIVNSSPQVVAEKASTDPQFGHMVQLMNYAQEEIGKMYSGGAVTDAQAQLFKGAFSPSNSVQTNVTNLEQAMKQIYGQYQQYAPFFHMQINAPNNQQQNVQDVTSNQFIQKLMNAAGQ